MHVDIYTDGAARGNPGPGGYGTVLRFVDSKGAVHEKELSQGYERTTNNRMELMAVVAGLEVLKRPCSITLYSDSQYVVNAFNQHWVDGWLKRGWKNAQKQPVKNDDLWKRLRVRPKRTRTLRAMLLRATIPRLLRRLRPLRRPLRASLPDPPTIL